MSRYASVPRLLQEACVVAAVIVVCFAAVHLVVRLVVRRKNLWTRNPSLIALQLAAAAALGHFAFEYTDMNQHYCDERPRHIGP